MTMADSDLVLDGNAAAGLLAEVFTLEATTAIVTCAGCGATGAMGETTVYAQAPGLVLRCPQCAAVLIRCAEIRDRIVVDLRGAATISLKSGQPG
jgi:hypothetical protein